MIKKENPVPKSTRKMSLYGEDIEVKVYSPGNSDNFSNRNTRKNRQLLLTLHNKFEAKVRKRNESENLKTT